MDRREFLAASAALACTARLAADEKAAEKQREPDLVLDKYAGAIGFSPDSKILAVANGPVGDDEGICFLDCRTWKRLPDFERVVDIKTTVGFTWPRVLTFSPDGKYFAAGGEGYVALWDATSGRRLEDRNPSPMKPWGAVTLLAFARDSKRFFAQGRFWSVDDARASAVVADIGNPDGFGVSRDGSLFATREAGRITIWDYAGLQKRITFGRKQPSGGPLLFTPDGAYVISREFGARKPHYFWDVKTGEPLFKPFEPKPEEFDLSNDGLLLVAITTSDLLIFRVVSGQVAHRLDTRRASFEDGMMGLHFSPDQSILACSRASGVRIWRDKNAFKV
jgi:WD40 repeat protein